MELNQLAPIAAAPSATDNGRHSSRAPRYRFPIQRESLPDDIGFAQAKIIQKHVKEVGLSWYPNHSIIDVELYLSARVQLAAPDSASPRYIACRSESALLEALEASRDDMKGVNEIHRLIPRLGC